MVLPSIFAEEDILNFELENQDVIKQPVKTYRLNIETGEIYAEFIDGNDAIVQHIIKALKTNRDSYMIYSSDYGSELKYLIGKGFSDDYIKMEAKRLVEEALMDYDRISEITDVIIERQGDSLYIEVHVLTDVAESLVAGVTI